MGVLPTGILWDNIMGISGSQIIDISIFMIYNIQYDTTFKTTHLFNGYRSGYFSCGPMDIDVYNDSYWHPYSYYSLWFIIYFYPHYSRNTSPSKQHTIRFNQARLNYCHQVNHSWKSNCISTRRSITDYYMADFWVPYKHRR